MLLTENSNTFRERSSSMNITTEKEIQRKHIETHTPTRLDIDKSILFSRKYASSRSSACTTGESTCESSGVSMEEFEKSEELMSGQITTATCGPLTCSENSAMSTHDESEAIYYFGYGPIVNPIVRRRRGCMIPPEDIKTAILYDHRLQFVAGGTANVVATRGWDVKGVLLKFKCQEDFDTFRAYDANYDIREISVSVIDKTNIDPKNKNDHTAPFEQVDEGNDQVDLDQSDRTAPLVKSRMYKSMLVPAINMSLNSLEDNSDSEEEDYSCPFSFEPKSKKADPNAIKCFTFVINQPNGRPRHSISENQAHHGKNGIGESVVGKPQERYLKLMTDGLRAHDIDETYIHDEVLARNYIPNERDKVTDQSNYKSFPAGKKISKVPQQKYENKLCKAKDNATHFVIGSKIMRIDEGINNNLEENPCLSWMRIRAHGQGDMTFLVHQTFVDKECLRIPLVDKPEDLTEEHEKWAEHVIFLYLERGGLTATTVGELVSSETNGSAASLKDRLKAMPSLGSRFRKKPKSCHHERASLPEANLSVRISELQKGDEYRNTQSTSNLGIKQKNVFGKNKLFNRTKDGK